MKETSILVRASKTSPHSGQQSPRHLFTLRTDAAALDMIAATWGRLPGQRQLLLCLGYAGTDGRLVLVKPEDKARVQLYQAAEFKMRVDTQVDGHFRGSVSDNQAPWLAEIAANGMADAEFVHQPETDNFMLFWKEVRPAKHITRRKVGQMLSIATSKIDSSQLSPVLLDSITKRFPPEPKVAAPTKINSVLLDYNDGSLQMFENLTLAQMVEIQNTLTRMTS